MKSSMKSSIYNRGNIRGGDSTYYMASHEYSRVGILDRGLDRVSAVRVGADRKLDKFVASVIGLRVKLRRLAESAARIMDGPMVRA